MIFLDLARNFAILFALCMGYTMVARWRNRSSLSGQVLVGIIFGISVVVGMLTPVTLLPGVIFDGRSILIGIAGLFCGGFPVLIAALIALACRIVIGGAGVYMGCGVIISSAVLGVGYHHLRARNTKAIKVFHLFVFGVVVHLAMLFWVVALPAGIRWQVLQTIALPVLLVYPVGTVLVGQLLANQDAFSNSGKALKKSEENLTLTLNSIGDAVISVDIEKRVVRMNPVAEALTGWTVAEALGHPLDEVFNIIHAQTREKAENPVERVLREGVVVGLANHTAVIARDGTEHQISDSAAPIRNAEGKVVGVVLVFRDVTELYEKEEALRQSELKYRTFFENSTDAMLIIENDRFVDCNAAAVSLLKSDGRKEILDAHPSRLSPKFQPDGESSAKKADEIMRLTREQGKYRFDWEHQRKDGTVFPVEVSLTSIATEQGTSQLLAVWRDMTEKREVEQALRAEKDKLETVLNAMADGLYIVNQKCDIEYVNPVLITDFGPYEGRKCYAYLHDRDTPCPWCKNADVFAGKTIRWEWESPMNGKTYDLFDTPLVNTDGSISKLEIFRDITERKRIEMQLFRREAMLSQSEKISHTGCWELDVLSGELSWSDEVYRIFGQTPHGFSATYEAFLESVHPEDRAAVDAAYSDSVRDGKEGYEVDHRIVRKHSGEIRFVHEECVHKRNAEGDIIQSLGVVQDITDQRELEEEHMRLSVAIDQVEEGVIITDVKGGILYVNPAFERMTGYSQEEMLGETPRSLQRGEQSGAISRSMWKTLLKGKTWSGRLVNEKKDGTLYTEEITISPMKNSNGKVVNYVAIKTDVTADLIRDEQVRQTQKMESIGRLAGGVAHDFNNILQTITGFCGLLLSEIGAQSAQRKDVLEIQKAAHHAADLTRQLLTFSRKQPTEQKSIDLNTILSEGTTMLRQALDENVQLHFESGPQLKRIRADASQVLQIAMNLIVNARDAMPEGGRITLRTKNIRIQRQDLSGIPGSKVGAWVCFSVSDTGCGMDDGQQAHLFDPFYTTKQPGKGTGLGLSVVYGIVEEHGGWISVSSELGKGSVFQVCLPVQDDEGSDVAKGTDGYDACIGKQILLVEDDPVIRELTAGILQDVGYKVTVAADADEAQKLFSEKTGAFDMLFSDVVLPDGNGLELAGSFQEQQSGFPVLLFSGYSDERARVDLIHEKGFNYIRKPFNLKKLLDAVSQTVAGSNG